MIFHLISSVTRQVAYLDPGSGSMLIQLILAALLGAGVLIRAQWSRIKTLFGRKNNPDEKSDDDE